MDVFSESVVKTLAFFDLFNQPLTREELFFNLWQPPRLTYEEFLSALSYPATHWQSRNGFYFLPNREEIVATRQERSHINDKKFLMAIRAARYLRVVPWVRAVFVCNSVSMFTAGRDSDIDLFVVARPGRVWLARFWANLILRLSGQRVYGRHIADRVCLSFFADEENLALGDLRFQNDDVYLIYWLVHCLPIYDQKKIFSVLADANRWLANFLPHSDGWSRGFGSQLVKDNRFSLFFKKIGEGLAFGRWGDFWEKVFRRFQENKIKKNLGSGNEPTGVVLSAGIIKLHPRDRRREYYEKWARAF